MNPRQQKSFGRNQAKRWWPCAAARGKASFAAAPECAGEANGQNFCVRGFA